MTPIRFFTKAVALLFVLLTNAIYPQIIIHFISYAHHIHASAPPSTGLVGLAGLVGFAGGMGVGGRGAVIVGLTSSEACVGR